MTQWFYNGAMRAYPFRDVPARDRAELLLRYHRQRVDWDKDSCPHTRALYRIKRTLVWRNIAEGRAMAAEHRKSEALLRLYA